MTQEESLLRGITHKDLKNTVRAAFDTGWEFDHWSGTTHVYIVWPPNKMTVSFGTTPSDVNAHKNVIKKIEAVMGKDLFPKHRSGRSAHKPQKERFIDTRPAANADALTDRVQQLTKEHGNLVLQFTVLSKAPVTRSDINEAAKIIRRLAHIETVLEEMYQPFSRFVPKD